MNNAVNKMKAGEKRKASELVTLEEESNDVTCDEELEDNSYEVRVTKTFELNATVKENIEKTVERTMDDLFKGVKSLLEGNEPLAPHLASNNDDDGTNKGLPEDHYSADEEIWKSFAKLKEIASSIEFPVEILQQLASANHESSRGIDKQDDGHDDLPEQVAPPPAAVGNQFSSPKLKPALLKNQDNTAKTRPDLGQITGEGRGTYDGGESGEALLAASRNHEESPVKKTPKALSLYYCPITNCSYSTTKEGMKKGDAALHLKNDHHLKAKDMKPGKFKFEKRLGQ